MQPDLKRAVHEVLPQVEIVNNASNFDERAEYARLRELRELGLMRELSARLAILVTLGWKRTDICEAMDVTRVTINNWLSAHTLGEHTYDIFRGDLERDRDVLRPVLNRLSDRAGQAMSGLRFEHDKFVVPLGFEKPLEALWRVAYRARGHELTTDEEVAAVSDALDVLISVLLRRGVTNIAIAKAAGVTHRAVLDRMNRARQRGLLLDCDTVDGECEAFFGENEIRRAYGPQPTPSYISSTEWLTMLDDDCPVVPIRLTSPRPSQYWLQTLTHIESGDPALLSRAVETHAVEHSMMRIAKLPCVDDEGSVSSCSEDFVASRLGRMSEDSPHAQAVAQLREGIMFVPAALLYTEKTERIGITPRTSQQAYSSLPTAIIEKHFAPHELVTRCFFETEDVLDEYAPTTKHAEDAKTRRH